MGGIKTGEKLIYNGGVVRVIKLLSLDKIEIQDAAKRIQTVSRKSLSPIPPDVEVKDSDEIFALSNEDYAFAEKRYKLIEPILASPGDGSIVKKVAETSGNSINTLYRWVKTFREIGTVESLSEGRGKALSGRKLIEAELEEIVTKAIKEVYLTRDRKSITKVLQEVDLQCRNKKIAPPHHNTIRKRINDLDPELVSKERFGTEKARDKFGAMSGQFPDPVHALQVVQIDHTPLDILAYDPLHNKPVKGRLYLTTALDVVTRMIVGYYLSFFKPGFVNAGLCLASAILPKESTLERLKIPGDWPCWGKMAVAYLDNAKEFRGNSIIRSCAKHGIILTWRPRKNPRFSGHIESFQKTLNTELHNLPGSTFHNVKHRDNYDSERKAALTFEEIEAFIVDFIVNIYHVRLHPALKRPPIALWEEQIKGNGKFPGIGFQEPPDERSTKISFMPSFVRTIQNNGVSHEGITYYSNTFKPFIKRTNIGRGKKMKEYEFRWDPRALRCIYFLHPEKKTFEPIELANIQFHNIDTNIWEYKAIQAELKRQGMKEVDQDRIFGAIARNQEREKMAIDRKQKAKSHQKKIKLKNSETKAKPQKEADDDDPFAGIDIDSINPFE